MTPMTIPTTGFVMDFRHSLLECSFLAKLGIPPQVGQGGAAPYPLQGVAGVGSPTPDCQTTTKILSSYGFKSQLLMVVETLNG